MKPELLSKVNVMEIRRHHFVPVALESCLLLFHVAVLAFFTIVSGGLKE